MKEVINPKSSNAELKILNHIQSIDANSQLLKAS
jgi:hypothetical protein